MLGTAGCALALTACSFQVSGSDDTTDGTDRPDDDVAPDADAAVRSVDAAPLDAMPPDPAGLARATPAAAPIAADGSDAEYRGAPRYEFALGSLAGNYIADEDYTPSMSAQFRMVHNASYVGWFIEVSDAAPVNDDGAAYLDDAVSIYLDLDGDNSGLWQAQDREIIVDIGETVELYNNEIGDPDKPDVDRDYSPVVGGFTLELRLRRGTYWGPDITTVGFNLALFDDDDNSDTDGGTYPDAYGLWFDAPGPRCANCCAAWPRDEAWCDTSFNGTLVLDP